MPTQDQVLDALKKVKFPGLSRDIVSFGFVRDVSVDGGVVSFTIHFQTENPSVGQQIARDAEAAVRALAGVTGVNLNLQIGAKQVRLTWAFPPPPDGADTVTATDAV